jgi:signal transduction histidine kinase
VQLQQVMLNLVMNAVEAMNATSEGARELLISTRKAQPDVVLAVERDSGPGLAPLDQLFDAFYTIYNEARRPSAGAIDLSLDYRNAWGPIVGNGQCTSRRDF